MSDPGRCCDLCDVHHSCQFWTYHFKGSEALRREKNFTALPEGTSGKSCELKLAKSDELCCDLKHTVDDCPHDCRDVIVSGERHGDAPPQDWAHFCFDCHLPSEFLDEHRQVLSNANLDDDDGDDDSREQAVSNNRNGCSWSHTRSQQQWPPPQPIVVVF